jgi:putative ABC transport system permease protein
MRHLLGDLKYAGRALRRQPGLSTMAVLTLMLGIGANTAIFSVIKAVLLDPLPYAHASRLVVLSERSPRDTIELVSTPTYLDWKSQTSSFAAMAAYRHARYAFNGGVEPVEVAALRVTPDLFSVLEARAEVGRVFGSEAGTPGADRVVVLGQAFWQRHFGGSRSAIGRTIELDGVPHEIIGVMPAAFGFPSSSRVALWTPLAFDPKDGHGRSRQSRALNVIARLDEGLDVDAARQELRVVATRLAAEYPESNAGWGAEVVPAHDQLVASARPALLVLLSAVGFLLLIVCVNVANLLLARLSTRRREIAVRTALGAGRGALVRQILAESALLSIIGGMLGLVVAFASVRLVRTVPATSLPRVSEVALDGGVLLFALGLSLLVALVFGLVPALQVTRGSLRGHLHEGTSGSGTLGARRTLNVLVVVEVALAFVLLAGAGLAMRSFARLISVDPGFDPANLLAAQIYLPPAKYAAPHQRVRFFEDLVVRLRRLPGVNGVAAVTALPMHPVGIEFALPFTIEDRPLPATGEEPRADVRAATPDYFRTMGVRLVSGRLIEARDEPETPHVAVINQTMARRYFDGENPVGRVINNPHGRNEIVGVVTDLRHQGLDREPRPELYLPFRQNPFHGMAVIVRTDAEPESFVPALRRELAEVDAGQPIHDLSTMDQVIARSALLPRLSMVLLGAFAALALLLAIVGIYGVVSYSVAHRTSELGVRMALGADAGANRRLVLGESLTLAGTGVLFGLAGAAAVTRALAAVLFDVSALDPAVFLGVPALVMAAAWLATWVPARRATRVDPIVALRAE